MMHESEKEGSILCRLFAAFPHIHACITLAHSAGVQSEWVPTAWRSDQTACLCNIASSSHLFAKHQQGECRMSMHEGAIPPCVQIWVQDSQGSRVAAWQLPCERNPPAQAL